MITTFMMLLTIKCEEKLCGKCIMHTMLMISIRHRYLLRSFTGKKNLKQVFEFSFFRKLSPAGTLTCKYFISKFYFSCKDTSCILALLVCQFMDSLKSKQSILKLYIHSKENYVCISSLKVFSLLVGSYMEYEKATLFATVFSLIQSSFISKPI